MPYVKDVPRQVAIDPVTSVCSGFFHSVAITVEGALWSWGCNAGGRLGHGDDVARYLPTAVASIAELKVKQVAAGLDCTLIIDADGFIWTAGQLNPYNERTRTFTRFRCCPEAKNVTEMHKPYNETAHTIETRRAKCKAS